MYCFQSKLPFLLIDNITDHRTEANKIEGISEELTGLSESESESRKFDTFIGEGGGTKSSIILLSTIAPYSSLQKSFLKVCFLLKIFWGSFGLSTTRTQDFFKKRPSIVGMPNFLIVCGLFSLQNCPLKHVLTKSLFCYNFCAVYAPFVAILGI